MNTADSHTPSANNVAMVAGGSSGIGLGVAKALATSGWRVVLVARTASRLHDAAGEVNRQCPSTTTVQVADVTDPDQVEVAVAEIERSIGAVQLLVNSVGQNDCIGPAWLSDAEEWWHDVEVNLRGVFNPCRSVLKRMTNRRSGRIVTITSGAGNFPMPMATSYSVAKAGVQRLTESLAISLKPLGITIFGFSPGSVRTSLTEKILSSDKGRRYLPELCNLPTERWSSVEEVATWVAMLASGRADALTGRFITIRDNLDELLNTATEIISQEKLVLRMRN